MTSTATFRRATLAFATLGAGALCLAACGPRTPDNSSAGTTTADQIPANQGMGGANDGAPGAGASGDSSATGQPGNQGAGDPAGAQNYPASGQP